MLSSLYKRSSILILPYIYKRHGREDRVRFTLTLDRRCADCLDVEDKFCLSHAFNARVVFFRYGVQGEREDRSLFSSVTRIRGVSVR